MRWDADQWIVSIASCSKCTIQYHWDWDIAIVVGGVCVGAGAGVGVVLKYYLKKGIK